MGTGSFPGLSGQPCDVDHPPSFSAEVKERVELYPYSCYSFYRASAGVEKVVCFMRKELFFFLMFEPLKLKT